MFKLILILIAVLIFSIFVVKPIVQRVIRRIKEAKLRENPPEVIRFKVKLPGTAVNSNEFMARFWERIHRVLPNDKKSLEDNTNILQAAIVGEGQKPGVPPKIFFTISCHPSVADRVQMELIESYNGEAQLIRTEERKDALGRWMISYRENIAYQKALDAQGKEVQDEDDEDE